MILIPQTKSSGLLLKFVLQKRDTIFFFLVLNVFLLLNINTGHAQTFQWVNSWDDTLTGDYGDRIAVDTLGFVYHTTSFSGTVDLDPGPLTFNATANGTRDFAIIKTDSNGNFIWAKQFGYGGFDECFSIDVDVNGDILIAGTYEDSIDMDPGPNIYKLTNIDMSMFVAKLDSGGNLVWAKAIRRYSSGASYGILCNTLKTDTAGNVYITGRLDTPADFDPGPLSYYVAPDWIDIFILKLNTLGNFVWVKRYGDNSSACSGRDISITKQGDVIVSGFVDGSQVNFNIGGPGGVFQPNVNESAFVLKLRANGQFVWVKRLSNDDTHIASGVVTDGIGNIYLMAGFDGTVDFDLGPGTAFLTSTASSHSFVLKLDSSGNYIWVKPLGGYVGYYWYTGFDIDQENSILVCNTISGQNGQAYDFDPGPGVYNISKNLQYMYIQKFDSAGNFKWAEAIGGANLGNCKAKDAIFDKKGNIYANGVSFGALADFDPGADTVYSPFYPPYSSFFLKLKDSIHLYHSQTIVSCSNSVSVNGIVYTTSGHYTQYFQDVHDCDSNTSYEIILNPPTIYNITVHACDQYYFNLQWLTSSGVYLDTFMNMNGCDSIVQLSLYIHQSSHDTLAITACDSYNFNGQLLTTSGVFIDSSLSIFNCDSVTTLFLTLLTSSSDTIVDTSCGPYNFNGSLITQSGIYYDTLANVNGCDSILILDLFIVPVNNNVTQVGAILSANQNNAQYQWLYCDPYTVISGANSSTYTATANGDYALAINYLGCNDTSSCITVSGLMINDFNTDSIKIYPTLFDSKIWIEKDRINKNDKIQIYSVSGYRLLELNLAQNKECIDLNRFTSGVYILKIFLKDKIIYTRVVKK